MGLRSFTAQVSCTGTSSLGTSSCDGRDDISGRPAEPVLIDFGAAKQNYLARHSRSLAPYTPGYAAYEQMSSEGDIGPWTDLYAVGALMWRMVAGGCPGDPRLVVPDEMTGSTQWNPAPRAVERRSYALHSGKPDPMVAAIELGTGRFSPNLLAAIDACLALIPENRVQSTEQLRKLIECQESSQIANVEAGSRSDSSRDGVIAAPSTHPSEHRDVETFHRRADRTGAWHKANHLWHTLAGRLKRYMWQETMISARRPHQGKTLTFLWSSAVGLGSGVCQPQEHWGSRFQF